MFGTNRRAVIESEGALSPCAATNEGRLLLAVIENCFLCTGIQLRLIKEHKAQGLTGRWDRVRRGGDSYGAVILSLEDEKRWIESEDLYPVSLKFICEFVAVYPDGFREDIRKAHKKVLERGWFQQDRGKQGYHYGKDGFRVYHKAG